MKIGILNTAGFDPEHIIKLKELLKKFKSPEILIGDSYYIDHYIRKKLGKFKFKIFRSESPCLPWIKSATKTSMIDRDIQIIDDADVIILFKSRNNKDYMKEMRKFSDLKNKQCFELDWV